jgi:hypothetical protein
MFKNRWLVIGASVFPSPCSPDQAITHFYLFGRLKQPFSEKTLDSEKNVFETITEILSELPKDELKSAFAH